MTISQANLEIPTLWKYKGLDIADLKKHKKEIKKNIELTKLMMDTLSNKKNNLYFNESNHLLFKEKTKLVDTELELFEKEVNNEGRLQIANRIKEIDRLIESNPKIQKIDNLLNTLKNDQTENYEMLYTIRNLIFSKLLLD